MGSKNSLSSCEQIRTATRFESFELRVRCDANEYTNNNKTDTIKFSM